MQTERAKRFAAWVTIAVMVLAPASPSFAGAKTTHTINGVQWRELTPAEVKMIPALTARHGTPQLPPVRYDHFNPNVKIMLVPVSMVKDLCRGLPSPLPPLACTKGATIGQSTPCVIVLPNKHPALAIMLRHEMGHCNGWPATHPN